MMRILILSFYYEPDLCAGSFRTTAFVKELTRRLGANDSVHVVTTMPNRYRSFEVDALTHESSEGLIVDRVPLPSHNSGMRDQARAFVTFARGAQRLTRGNDYDVVFATSSRLFTAVLGATVARRVKAPLYLDLRDIFPDTMSDVLKGSPARMVLPFLQTLERKTVRSAARINLVSEGFRPYFENIAPEHDYRLFTNGIDEDFIDISIPFEPSTAPPNVVYAGNIGEGQGLHRIVPQIAKQRPDVHFIIVGDGGARTVLEESVARAGVTNIELRPPVSRNELIGVYKEADILFLHLNAYPAFEKVLPSKIFEYAAMEKPILAGVGGYSAQFIRDNVANAQVFDPCDYNAASKAINQLRIERTDRTEFVQKYARRRVMRSMVEDVLSLVSADSAAPEEERLSIAA